MKGRKTACTYRGDRSVCLCETRPVTAFDHINMSRWIEEGDTIEQIAVTTNRDLSHLIRQRARWLKKDPDLLHAATLVKIRQQNIRGWALTRPRKVEK